MDCFLVSSPISLRIASQFEQNSTPSSSSTSSSTHFPSDGKNILFFTSSSRSYPYPSFVHSYAYEAPLLRYYCYSHSSPESYAPLCFPHAASPLPDPAHSLLSLCGELGIFLSFTLVEFGTGSACGTNCRASKPSPSGSVPSERASCSHTCATKCPSTTGCV